MSFSIAPLYAHEGENEAFAVKEDSTPETINIDSQGQKALGLEFGLPRKVMLKETLKATGEVQAAETQAFDVNPPVSGLVKEVYVKQGDTVKKGQTLALVYSIEVANNLTQLLSERTKLSAEIARVQTQLKSDITLQTNQLQLAKINFEREEELLKEGISSRKSYQETKNAYDGSTVKLSALRQRLEQEVKLLQKQRDVLTDTAKGQLRIMGLPEITVDQALKSGAVTADLPIIAPVNGCIVTRSITLGERVDPSKKVFAIVNLDPIWVMVDIFQEQIPKVKEGQNVVIHTPSKHLLSGVISSVGSLVDTGTKTLHVRIVAKNPQGILRPGMFVTAQIITGSANKETFVLPESALVKNKEQTLVYKKVENGFEPLFVETGMHTNNDVEITNGIAAGDLIVTSGAQQLQAQNLLKPGIARAHEGEEHEDHSQHEKDEEPQAAQPVKMFFVFLSGLITALVIIGIWTFVLKTGRKKGSS
ncbi:MAG: efflux RND transporter periplasmic adaptor subunit [Candidatus Obscuribacterales bacterium]|nr:efflux RND transporter periplasmic adaptor subunit [Candidatus Obscuribacterales bacterium]